MEDGMEDFWYGMEWKISGMEWNCMEDFECYRRWKIYIPFHSMPCLRLECEKSMELTDSSHPSCLFCPNRDSRDEGAQSESVPSGARMKER